MTEHEELKNAIELIRRYLNSYEELDIDEYLKMFGVLNDIKALIEKDEKSFLLLKL
ncbi:MAG: hypothetical protein WC783_00455 [Candidatus Paceibacterota bacterium]|jgi:hypothetical protein